MPCLAPSTHESAAPGLHPAPHPGCQGSGSPGNAQVQLHWHHSCPGAGDGHVNATTLAPPAKVTTSQHGSQPSGYRSTRSLLTLPLPLVSHRSFLASTLATLSVSGTQLLQRCSPAGEWGLLELVSPCLQMLPDILPAPTALHPRPALLCHPVWVGSSGSEDTAGRARQRPLAFAWFPCLTASLSSWDMWGKGAKEGIWIPCQEQRSWLCHTGAREHDWGTSG